MEATRMRFFAGQALLVIFCFLSACREDRSERIFISLSAYRVESDPSLSPDGQWVYLIANDTTLAIENGIYRARISSPRRELVVAIDSAGVPTGSPGNSRIAYLKNGRIFQYKMSGGITTPSPVTDSFVSLIFVNDTLLAAANDSAIYLVNIPGGTKTYFGEGYDVALLAPDSLVYFVVRNQTQRSIVKSSIAGGTPDTLLVITLPGSASARWPSYQPQLGRLAYTLQYPDSNAIYSAKEGAQNSTYHGRSNFAKTSLITYEWLVRSGPDGRLWVSSFTDTVSFPFWHIESD